MRPTPRRGIAMLGVLIALVLLSTLLLPTSETQLGSTARAAASEPAPPPPADSWTGTLRPGQTLRDEAAGGNTLTHQTDGNVVLRNADGKVLWHTGTHGRDTARLAMQSDGNLVLYDAANRPIFQTKTNGTGATLTLQGDANAVLYAPEPHVKWAAMHWPPPPPPTRGGDPASNRRLGHQIASQRGWGGSQFSCLDSLWTKESGWSHTIYNRQGSGAYGIPQALPGSKMSSHGSDWRTNPATQIRWGLSYIHDRYGTPCGAWKHSQARGWY